MKLRDWQRRVQQLAEVQPRPERHAEVAGASLTSRAQVGGPRRVVTVVVDFYGATEAEAVTAVQRFAREWGRS